jgi:hypothetical protein
LTPPGASWDGQDGGNGVGDEDDGEQQEDPFGVAVGTEEHERPDGDGGDGDREIARDPEQVEGGGDAAELGHHEADVGDGEGGDGEGGQRRSNSSRMRAARPLPV